MNFFLSLCCVFFFHLFFTFVCLLLFFYDFGGIDLERSAFFQLHLKYNKLCVSSALLDNDLKVFILNFVQTSLQEDTL